MNYEEKDNIAYETASYWTNNCIDEDFADNCINTIMQEVNDINITNEIWNIIEEKYLNLD